MTSCLKRFSMILTYETNSPLVKFYPTHIQISCPKAVVFLTITNIFNAAFEINREPLFLKILEKKKRLPQYYFGGFHVKESRMVSRLESRSPPFCELH